MAKLVFEMLAFGSQNVVVFVFDFPASASSLDQREPGLLREVMIGHEGVVVELLTGFGVGYGHLNETTRDDFGQVAIEAAVGYLVKSITGCQGVAPFIQDLKGISLANITADY